MGQLETKWGKSWDAHQFTNPGMHADFRIPTCAPIPADQVTSLAKSCVPGCFAEQVTLLAKPRVLRNAHPIPGCAPNPCQFPNPGMHANSVSRNAYPSRLLRSPSPGFCGMHTNFRIPGCVPFPGFAKCAPNPGMRTQSLPISQSRDARQFPCPGTLRQAGYSARQVPGFAGCAPISESRDACRFYFIFLHRHYST